MLGSMIERWMSRNLKTLAGIVIWMLFHKTLHWFDIILDEKGKNFGDDDAERNTALPYLTSVFSIWTQGTAWNSTEQNPHTLWYITQVGEHQNGQWSCSILTQGIHLQAVLLPFHCPAHLFSATTDYWHELITRLPQKWSLRTSPNWPPHDLGVGWQPTSLSGSWPTHCISTTKLLLWHFCSWVIIPLASS